MWIVIAFAVGCLSWWLTGRLTADEVRVAPLDRPNDRSLHHVPTPRSGGVAIGVSAVIGLLLVMLLSSPLEESSGRVEQLTWIASAALFLALISYVDDRTGLPVWLRLGCHALAASAVVVGGDVVLPALSVPGVGELGLGQASGPITFAFLLWMTNLYNFMDGMDGFAGGMTVIGFGLLAYWFWIGHQTVCFYIAAIVAAAALGFLIHNFPPAKIFMGDVGSIPIGFLAGSLAVFGYQKRVFDLWVPLVVLAPFIVDASVTLVRRLMRCEKIWDAHREHFYQRLVLIGWGHRKTVLVEYGVMGVCGILAVLYQEATEPLRLVILAGCLVLFLALAGLVTRLEGTRVGTVR